MQLGARIIQHIMNFTGLRNILLFMFLLVTNTHGGKLRCSSPEARWLKVPFGNVQFLIEEDVFQGEVRRKCRLF